MISVILNSAVSEQRNSSGLLARDANRRSFPSVGHYNSLRVQVVITADGIKIKTEYCQENILDKILNQWVSRHLSRRSKAFQKDAVATHSARIKQELLKNEFPSFISITQWPPKFSNASPLDNYAFCILRLIIQYDFLVPS